MRKAHLVCIIGIDGSGKTTQARKLTKHLKSKGVNAKYTYGRYVPILTRPLVVIGALALDRKTRRRGKTGDFATYTNEKKKALRKPRMKRLVYLLITAEYFLQLVVKIHIPLRAGKSVVSDRYIHDTVATDLAPNLGFGEKEILDSIQTLLTLAPEPSVLIYIRVRPEVAYTRKSDIGHIDYLRERIGIYDLIAASHDALIVDGENGQSQVQDEIRGIVEHALRIE